MSNSIIEWQSSQIKEISRFFYVPENFSTLDVLPPEFHKWADYTAYVLSTINSRIVFERLDPDSYVPLMSALLKRVLPWRDYRRILDLLVQLDVIEVDKSYQVGIKSKGYRLTSQYRGQVHRRYLVTHPDLLHKLAKLRQDMHDGIILPVHRHLWRMLQEIDFVCDGDGREFGIYYRQAQDIIQKQFHFSVCQFGSRVHTNITNLHRPLRQYLRHRNKVLYNLDVANSQPLILGIVVLNYYLHGANSLSTANSFTNNELNQDLYHNPELLSSILNSNKKEEGGIQPLCGDIRISTLDIPDDLKRYLHLCESGRLYEYLMEQTEAYDRDAMKEKFFQVMFAKNKVEQHLTLSMIFKSDFPSVINAMREIKRKDHLAMAQMLQRMESSLMIQRVCGRLLKECPETFVVTIHDSIVTTVDQAMIVGRIMREEYGKLGIRPTIRTETLSKAVGGVQESLCRAG